VAEVTYSDVAFFSLSLDQVAVAGLQPGRAVCCLLLHCRQCSNSVRNGLDLALLQDSQIPLMYGAEGYLSQWII